MTDYERVTTRETTAVDPAVDPMTASPAVASTVRTTDRAYVAAGPSGATTAARIVTFAFGILQVLLILRIVLLLLVANPGNGLVDAIFSITQPFVEPFIGMFSLDKRHVRCVRPGRRGHRGPDRLDARRGPDPRRAPDLPAASSRGDLGLARSDQLVDGAIGSAKVGPRDGAVSLCLPQERDAGGLEALAHRVRVVHHEARRTATRRTPRDPRRADRRRGAGCRRPSRNQV